MSVSGVPSAARRGRLADGAYEYLKARLLDGGFAPGERIPVDDVVRALKVSRQPVMEAVKRLAGEGFLEIVPQVGCKVVVPEQREIEDFFRVFSATEGLCAELAATRASRAELDALAAVAAELELTPSMGPEQRGQAYRRHNREFHAEIHRLAHSMTIHAIARELWDRADFFINTSIGTVPFVMRVEDAVSEHRDILAAIRRRDGALARRRMEEHVFAFATAMRSGAGG